MALGAIVLAVTGAEALYADMGHFGRAPIRLAWFGLVLPGLVLNYFGQGALVLRDPAALEHPFYHLVPGWALWPLIGLATCATIIASQAVISGVFSLTRQAVQLGYLPRMTIRHTSATEIGQVYLPRVNWLLMVGVLLLVVGFGSSGNLAAAYGISVTGAMAIDAVLAGLVAAWRWGWGPAAAVVFGTFFLHRPRLLRRQRAQDPRRRLVPARGRRRLRLRRGHLAPRPQRGCGTSSTRHALPIASFLDRLDPALIRVPGTAVYMTGNPEVVPMALLHNIKHNQVLHEQVVLMTVRTQDIPYVAEEQRIEVEALGKGFFRVVGRATASSTSPMSRRRSRCAGRGTCGRIRCGPRSSSAARR